MVIERNRADLIELFKMIHGFTDAPLSAVLQITTDSSTKGHDKKLIKSHCHTNSRLHFFSARVINRWNSLTQAMVDATSVNAFKRHLDICVRRRWVSLWTRSPQNPIGCWLFLRYCEVICHTRCDYHVRLLIVQQLTQLSISHFYLRSLGFGVSFSHVSRVGHISSSIAM